MKNFDVGFVNSQWKPEDSGIVPVKCREKVTFLVALFRMYLNLKTYQLKIDCSRYRVTYISLVRTIRQKPAEDIQIIKGKEPKHNTTGDQKTAEEQKEQSMTAEPSENDEQNHART